MNGPTLVALVLAVFAGAALLTLAIGSVFARNITLDPAEAELLGTAVGAAVGAVAGFIGGARGRPPEP